MKMFFTYLIATLLFGLCIFEKESRKKALESEFSDKNYIKLTRKSIERPASQNFVADSEYKNENNLVSDDGFSREPSSQFIATDSLNINFEMKQQEGKIF